MQKKNYVVIVRAIFLLFLLSALLLPACAKEAAPAPTTPAPAVWEWPNQLSFIAASTTSSQYGKTSSIIPILENSTGMKCRIIPEEHSLRRVERFDRGEADIAHLGFGTVSNVIRGIGGAAEAHGIPEPVGVLWYCTAAPWGVFTRGDSELETIYDIKEMGKDLEVGWNSVSPGMTGMIEGVLAFVGLTMDDVTMVPASGYTPSLKTVSEGRSDIAVANATSGGTYEVEGTPQGIKWLPMPPDDKEGWKRFLEHSPSSIPGVQDCGVESAIGNDGYQDIRHWFVRLDFDEELAYQLAKWLDENYDLYKDAHVTAFQMSIDNFRGYLDAKPKWPVHKGTIRYLKEIGKWTSADDTWNEAAINLQRNWQETTYAVFTDAKDKEIEVSVDNQEWLDLRASYQAGLDPFKTEVE